MPVYTGENTKGFHVLVYLDGVLVDRALCEVDTDKGTILAYVLDDEGKRVISSCGCCYTVDVLHGNVSVRLVRITHYDDPYRSH